MIDLHCDTLLRIWEDGGQNSLASNPYSVDLDGLEKAGALAQCFAIFTPPEGDRWATMRALHDIFVREMEVSAGRISQAFDAADIASRRLSAILTIEDMGATEAKEERIDEVLSWSPRIISLVWNNENAFACPNSPDPQLMAKGLKKAGHELIERMGGRRMLLDVSHLSDGGFWDVMDHEEVMVVATHSNARAVTAHPRNLTDAMIRAIAERGGVVGLNFCPAFLTTWSEGTRMEDEVSRIDDMVRHIMHIRRVGGDGVIALGSDFDGIGGQLEIAHSDEVHKLFEALEKAGLPPSSVDKLAKGNALRVLA